MNMMLVVCKTFEEGPAPGFVRGYFCEACECELQVTPHGVARIASGGHAFCNPCGFALDLAFRRNGSETSVELSPTAERQVIEGILKDLSKTAGA